MKAHHHPRSLSSFAIKEPAGCVAGELCRGSSRQWHGMFVSKRGTLSFERNHLNKRHSTLRLLVSRVYARNGPPRRRLSASDRRACFKRLGRNSPQRHVSPTVEQNATAGGPQEACRREAAWACGAGGCTHSRFSVSDCSFPWIPFAHQEGGLALPSAARMAGATGPVDVRH